MKPSFVEKYIARYCNVVLTYLIFEKFFEAREDDAMIKEKSIFSVMLYEGAI